MRVELNCSLSKKGHELISRFTNNYYRDDDDWWDNDVSIENENRKHTVNKNIDNEDMTISTDNSSEIKNAENLKETKNLDNNTEAVHEKKTDTLLNVETGNEVKKEKFLIIEYPDNNLEDDVGNILKISK